ncbi:glycoside hydrolase family 66 protein [uncultured Phocaeicola sp.]|uniref:glycoside hydrolase family 66 protein n=1 Tax=uncultured Phocaeicola sp. TaxID=990718 RepID=UPI0025A217F8|nr:glycoside hydrolase family 66 protein [uncultured Phocaeicola sp.]
MKTGRKRWQIAGICILLIILGAGLGSLYENSRRGKYEVGQLEILIDGTDKARYAPGEEAVITASVRNLTEKNADDILLEMNVYHLGEAVYSQQQSLAIAPGEEKGLSLNWQPPDTDYQGYLICLKLTDSKGNYIAQDTTGIDISSDWVKFPRYGYLCDYGEEENTEEKIAQMNRYHINAIEYYDWHALHHEPIPEEVTRQSPGVWEDWSGREIYGETVRNYIQNAQDRNMVSMAYNMIYAGTDSFVKDVSGNPTKAADWQIYFAPENERGEGMFTFKMGASPSGNGNLFFMNPLNADWQDYIFSQEKHALDVLGFDGWHGDTVGDWGKMVDAFGNPLGTGEDGESIYEVKDTYRQFLNAAKEALEGYYLSFNPVGAQGIEQVNTSNSDVLYTEFWPWDQDRDGVLYDTYQSLVTEVERTMEESKPYSADGKGKSLVVKAYINYYKTTGTMNVPGVLLCDAAVYAAGGSRLELGNGNHMLHVEYYPDDDIPMGDELQEAMAKMADFTVAYENLLRDGQFTTENRVEIAEHQVSRDGQGNTIWAYTRADGEYEILHLINLLGTDNEWRDERGKKEAPSYTENLNVKYYTEKEITQVHMASFSFEDGMSRELSFEQGEDSNGKYIRFTVPSLEYWDMIYMK